MEEEWKTTNLCNKLIFPSTFPDIFFFTEMFIYSVVKVLDSAAWGTALNKVSWPSWKGIIHKYIDVKTGLFGAKMDSIFPVNSTSNVVGATITF